MTTSRTPAERHQWKGSRRALAAGAAGLATTAVLPLPSGAQGTPEASPIASPVAGTGARYLLVADAPASTVYFYAIPDWTLTGQLDGVALDGHGGTIVLEDGTIYLVDGNARELLHVALDASGAPTIAHRVAVNIGEGVSWASADPSFRYLAIGSFFDGTPEQILNLVDTTTWTNVGVPLTTNDEELTVGLVGDPLTAVVSIGGQVDTYLLADLLAGAVEPMSSVPVDPGSHGAVVDTARDRFVLTTGPGSGFDVLDIAAGAATYSSQLPWDVDGLAGGRNARPRLGWDGNTIVGILTTTPETPEAWADTEASVHIADLTTDTVQRVALGTGRFAGRWNHSTRHAVFAGYDGTSDTGTAYLVSVDPAASDIGAIVATVPIDLPTNPAVPGSPLAETEGYHTNITRDDAWAFVVHGGDGLVTVIDVAAADVAGTITVPTPLTGAGYLAVVETGIAPVDLFGR